VLKTEANAWRAIEHRKLEVSSGNSEAHAVTVKMLVNRYLETELAELRLCSILRLRQEVRRARRADSTS
jgi:hypothetical protein